jgi:hypothetical protein
MNIEDSKNNKNVKNEVIAEEGISTNLINEEINSHQTKLQVITSNRERIIAKKQMLLETLEKFSTIGILNLKILCFCILVIIIFLKI